MSNIQKVKNAFAPAFKKISGLNLKVCALAGLLIVIVLCAALLYPSEPSKPKETASLDKTVSHFHIGVLAPLSGKFAEAGKSIERGARTASAVLNEKGGILGKQISLHIVDTRSQPSLTRELVKELVQRANVSLLIGTAGEESAIEAATEADSLQTPFIYSSNGFAKTCSANDRTSKSHYVWGSGLTREMMIEPFLIFLADRKRQQETSFRIYYFGTEDPSSKAKTKHIVRTAESLTFETIVQEYVDPRIKDYYQRIRNIFRKYPDLLFVNTSLGGTSRFIQQAAKLGVQSEMAIAGLAPFEEERLIEYDSSADGIYTVSRYTATLDNATNKEFLKNWRTIFPKAHPTAMAVAGAYNPIVLAAAGFEKAKSVDPLAFEQAMADLTHDLPNGNVMVSALNHMFIQPLYAVRIKQGKYILEEYLGDVAHPALEECSIPQVTTP